MHFEPIPCFQNLGLWGLDSRTYLIAARSMKGGKRIGSGRKAGVTDGRRQITIRINSKLLDKLAPGAARKIRTLVEALPL